MSHPPDRVADVENNTGKGGKFFNKNDKKKVLVILNFNQPKLLVNVVKNRMFYYENIVNYFIICTIL